MALPVCLVLLTVFTCALTNLQNSNVQPPHIICILSDDMGWNDVSYHGSDQIPTPNIDSLAYQGVILHRHYVQPMCSPTRATLMTGKYPIHTGVHRAYSPSDRDGLSLDEKLLPQHLKDFGYSTHLVGKWHLGFYKKEFTPLMRGFDSHFGYWSGAISYYDHIDKDPTLAPPSSLDCVDNQFSFSGHDFRRNYTPAWDLVGEYATDLFTGEAIEVINQHPENKPLYMHVSHLAPHAGNPDKWLEAHQSDINQFSYISDSGRRSYAAMVYRLDYSIGQIVAALERKDMLKNSIIIFIGDNGSPNIGVYNNWGSNFPFRGQKDTHWEGAIRTPALIWSPLINKPSRVTNSLMHVSDWLPTLLAAVGYKAKLQNIDGVNQWPMITGSQSRCRSELVVDIDDGRKMAALIVNNLKYIEGPTAGGPVPAQSKFLNFGTIKSENARKYGTEEIIKSPTWIALQKHSKVPDVSTRIPVLRQKSTVLCNHNFINVPNCTPDQPCLFNLVRDKCEHDNIAKKYPVIVQYMKQLMDGYRNKTIPSPVKYTDPASNPKFFNGTWSIWES